MVRVSESESDATMTRTFPIAEVSFKLSEFSITCIALHAYCLLFGLSILVVRKHAKHILLFVGPTLAGYMTSMFNNIHHADDSRYGYLQ